MSGFGGGYEFQDKITTLLSIKDFIENKNSKIIIEKKLEDIEDYFDDIIIENNDVYLKVQVKYSKDSNITVSMLSSGDLNLYKHYKTYLGLMNKQVSYKLVIITNRVLGEDLFKKDNTSEKLLNLRSYKLKIDKIIENNNIRENFNKLKNNFENEHSNMEIFKKFLSELTFFSVPKEVSFDYDVPKLFDNFILELLNNDIGIGQFPYQNESSENLARNIEEKIRSCRIFSEKAYTTDELFKNLGVYRIKDIIDNNFPIYEKEYINRHEIIESILNILKKENSVHIIGEPGSGKSWVSEKISNSLLNNTETNIVKLHFYISVEDSHLKERCNYQQMLYTIKDQLINNYKISYKEFITVSAVSEQEIIDFFKKTNLKFILILDGLDHIKRVKNENELNKVLRFIKIIKDLNIKLLLLSQPLDNNCNIQKIDISRITDKETKKYLEFFNLEDSSCEIYSKTKGNFLYTKYMVNALRNVNKENQNEFISAIKIYEGNIEKYYEYLIEGNDCENRILSLLCCTNIPLNSCEIKTILAFIKQKVTNNRLDKIKHILNIDGYGNFSLYHESIKRYFSEKHVKDQVDFKVLYLKPLFKFFNRKIANFFDSWKMYKYFIQLAVELNQYEPINNFINIEFVNLSVQNGYGSESILKNYKSFVITATRRKDFKNLIILSEMKKEIDALELNMDSFLEEYFEQICYINDCDEEFVNKLMCEFKPKYGLRVQRTLAAINNKNGYELEDYIDGELPNINTKTAKYIMNSKNPEKVLEFIQNLEISRDVLYFLWELDLKCPKIKDSDIDFNGLLILSGFHVKLSTFNISKAKEILDKTYIINSELLKLISFTHECDKSNLEHFNYLKEKTDWVSRFYYVLVNNFNLNKYKDDRIFIKYIKLLKNTHKNRYEGKPRACDMHFSFFEVNFLIRNIINNLKNEENIYAILDIILFSDENIIFGIHGLNIEELLDFINFKIKNRYMWKIYRKYLKFHKNSEFSYLELADYSHKLSHIRIKNNKRINKNFAKFVSELLAYTSRKDISFSCMIETVSLIEIPVEKLKFYYELLTYSRYILYRTDGKETRHFEYQIFEKFIKDFQEQAIWYVINKIRRYPNDYNIEKMINCIFENIEGIDENLVLLIYKSLNAGELTNIFESYARIINNNNTKIDDAKISYFEKDLCAKIYTQNNYKPIGKIDELNKFISHINYKYKKFEDLSIFKIEDGNIEKSDMNKTPFIVLDENYDLNNFWIDLRDKNIDYNHSEGVTILKHNINTILRNIKFGYKTDDLHSKIDYLIKIVEDVAEDEIFIEFLVKCFINIKDGWYRSCEYIHYFDKAYNISEQKTSEMLFIYLEKEMNSNFYTYNFSFNVIRLIKKYYNESFCSSLEALIIYQKKRLPYFKKELKLNLEIPKIYNKNTLIILLMMEKMKRLDKHSILNTLSSFKEINDIDNYKNPLSQALKDFYSAYDGNYKIIYRVLYDQFKTNINQLKKDMDIMNIMNSTDIILKAELGLVDFNNEENKIVTNTSERNIQCLLFANNLEKFINIEGIEQIEELFSDSVKYETFLNKNIMPWTEFWSILYPKLIIQNQLYCLILNHINNNVRDNKFNKYEISFIYNQTRFDIEKLIEQNNAQFIPINKNDFIIIEDRLYTHISKDYKMHVERKSENYILQSPVFTKEYIFDIKNDIRKNRDINPYTLNCFHDVNLNMTYKNICSNHGNERVEIAIVMFITKNEYEKLKIFYGKKVKIIGGKIFE